MTSPVGSSSVPAGSFPGIGSTFDYTSLVNALIQAQSQPGVAMQNRITAAQAQLSAYQTYNGLLTNLQNTTSVMRSGTAFQGVSANVSNATGSNGQALLTASALSGASPGSYAVKVTQTAQAEKLSGATFSGSSTPLGLSGDFVINGRTVTVASTDTLASVRDRINSLNSGSNASKVSAALVTDTSNAQRLVLTSTQTGAAGINLVDGVQGVGRQLGWLDNTETIKHATSAGGQSDKFASATASIGSQFGLTAAPGSQTVTIGGSTVSINLATDSLTSIASAFSALPGVQATVQSTTVNGATQYYLDVRNTTNFVDSGNALQQLGIMAAGKSAVAQQLQSNVMTDSNAGTPATASTLLTNLWNGGSGSGARAGDTLSISGTRGDGSSVSVSFTIVAGSTMQNLLDKLNDPTSGFGAGTRPATASVDSSGHVVLTDNTSGQSNLTLQLVANNQGGGRLDFGAFGAASPGRSRELVSGADAKFSVDGVAFTRSSNTVSDVIANTTLALAGADPNVTANVSVSLSSSAAQAAVQGYVSAYNAVIDYIKTQQTPGADQTSNPTLYNDPLLRSARSALSQSMLVPVAGAASDMATPDTVGISLTADGHLTFDSTKFQNAFATRYTDVTKLFAESGMSTNPSLVYTASTTATQPGTYAVNITQPASQAQVTGAAFSGTYNQPGAPDTMTVTDLASNSTAQIQLSGGMTTAQIVAALSASFGTPQNRALQASATLNDATGSSPAGSSTLITDLHLANGSSAGVVAGDTVGFSGARGDGTTYSGSFTVASSSTIANFVTQLQTTVGSGATVSFANGQLAVQSSTSGNSQLALSLTPNNQGGGRLSFGAMNVTATGHGILSLTATAVGNQIQIQHNAFGATPGFSVAYSGSGNPAAQLGIAAGSSFGTDVQGTIGGFTATGSGRSLVGAAGTPVDGMSLAYLGTVAGSIGNLTLTQGLGSVVDRLLLAWTQTGGTIQTQTQQINDTIGIQQHRLADFTARIAMQKAALMKQYSAMDSLVSRIRA
ncbi:MAG: flagellar filament capping protein FliD, partial [Gemmatimonadota bacterium]|nr:flagellar filament capping protein FliD [Gemmatimonadota bacterium]